MEILDYKLQHDLRRYIRELPAHQMEQLKSVHKCGCSLSGNRQAVYVLTSDEGHSKLHGVATCKNPFVCPVCSAKVMEKYRAKIAGAIECLHRDYFGVMVTFTIAHRRYMSCREQMDILFDTWGYFRLKSFNRDHGHIFHQLNQIAPVVHHVKVCEHTHGKNGWHAHFHCIFWFKRGDELEIDRGGWEQKLNDFWVHVAKLKTVQYWKKHNLHVELMERFGSYEAMAESLYFNEEERSQAIKFSRDENGNLREVNSAEYVAGWGSDKELTGNRRKEATHAGHRTPYQILNDAAHNANDKRLYMEYCLAMTRKPVHHRVDFSQTGISALIKEWQTNHPKESSIIQKKRKEDGTPIQWRVVAYFDKKQWCELCYLNKTSPVISNILYLAAHYLYLLGDYLESLGIRLGSAPRELEEVERSFNSFNKPKPKPFKRDYDPIELTA